MTREEATQRVAERWERLGLDKEAAPIMLGMDVDNMMAENPEPQIHIMPSKRSLLKSLNEQDQDTSDPEESSDTANGNEMWRNIGGRA